jgi:threonyl-tRNA synthetase
MIHRAIFGSLERFTGVLIENFAGHFPLWLAPLQVVVATIVSDADAYALEVLEQMKAAGLRAEVDLRNEKINYKVREHSLAKVAVMLVVGKREAEEGKVSIAARRPRADGDGFAEAIAALGWEWRDRGRGGRESEPAARPERTDCRYRQSRLATSMR